MEQEKDKPNAKEETRTLRKKVKRIEVSRSSIKAKNRKKGEIIKDLQGRKSELEESRDKWKTKHSAQEKACDELSKKYREMADLLQIKEEELREVIKEFEEVKKKHPPPAGWFLKKES